MKRPVPDLNAVERPESPGAHGRAQRLRRVEA